MTPDELFAKLKAASEKVPREVRHTIPEKIEVMGLRYLDDNFVNQSFEGHPWQETKKGGTILVKSGTLKSGFRSKAGQAEVRFRNVVKYASIHNNGFSGPQKVKEHTRGRYTGPRVKRKRKGNMTIEAHVRWQQMPRRQFAPTPDSPAHSLNRAIKEMTFKHFLHLIKDS
jgi:phage gpG-like protein